MWTFDELWGASRPFRQLFLYNKVFKKNSRITDDDMGRAEVLWSERRPGYKWHLCPIEGCQELVIKNEYCTAHFREKRELPSRKWFRGNLYRRVMVEIRNDADYKTSDPQYRKNHLYEAEMVYGEIPPGYTVRFIDGNPFNHARGNLLMLSKVVSTVVDVEGIPLGDAIDLDELLQDFVRERCGTGRPRQRWVYGNEDIAKAIGMTPSYVYRAVHRGRLDPSNLAEVIDFCKNVVKSA